MAEKTQAKPKKKVATKKSGPKKAAPKKATKKATSASSGQAAKKASPAPKKAAKKKSADEEVASKLRIRVRAYEHKVLDASAKQIIDTAMRYDATILGPVPLPTEKKKYTVNRSSFVHKDAREQFEMRVHKRLIDIQNPTAKVIEALTNLSLPSGVNVDVRMV